MRFGQQNLVNLLLIFLLAVLPAVSLAYGNNVACNPEGGKIFNPISATTLQGFIKTLLEGILKIGMPLIALAIIFCGFQFVAARGNSEKLTKARQSLMYTLIGAAILLGSWAIAKLISETVLSIS